MVLLNAAAAAGRYLFGDGLVGSDELMVFGMIWVVFIGAALLEREGRHLGFDLLIKHLPERPRQVLRVVIALGSAAVLSLVAWQSLARSEEHTSELQSLMRISYAVSCLQKKKNRHTRT